MYPKYPEQDAARPYFFLSYAHTPRSSPGDRDPNHWVYRLYADLCTHIMEMADVPRGAQVGYMDRGMLLGDLWSERLSEALSTCRVFVPLYSPRYFRSEMCGREWWAFAQREALARSHTATASSGIVPVVWVPVESSSLPSAAARLQVNHEEFGQHYAVEGLYGLMKLSYLRDEYERAVYRLARRIVRTAENTSVAPGPPPHYGTLPSAFSSAVESRPVRIVVVAPTRDQLPPGRSEDCYGSSALAWNPYHPATDMPLATYAGDLARGLEFQPSLASFDRVAEELLAGRASDGPVVLLIDRWAVRDPQRREQLSLLDSVAPPWIGAVIPWNLDDPDNSAENAPYTTELDAVMPEILKQGRSASRAGITGVRSLDTFGHAFAVALQRLSVQYLRRPTSEAPRSSQPRLIGPLHDQSAPVSEEAPGERRS
ncbi:TIR-like protein FxsC [Streptomyces griseorubiginosus]|uniref:TIR-like protein FxsC n=1 Tax=Streptomyces griseorubiginosus TaxID=67304 RepID=UPI00368BEFE3